MNKVVTIVQITMLIRKERLMPMDPAFVLRRSKGYEFNGLGSRAFPTDRPAGWQMKIKDF